MLFPIKIDTARSKFDILSNDSLTLDETIKNDEGAMKNLLKKKWNEISSK